MKRLFFILFLPAVAHASVTIYNNTDFMVTVADSVGTPLASVPTKTTVTVSPAGFAHDLYFTINDSKYSIEAIDGAFVSISPTFDIRATAPVSAWLDFFRLGFKIQIGFELFGLMIRLCGSLRKPTGAEL